MTAQRVWRAGRPRVEPAFRSASRGACSSPRSSVHGSRSLVFTARVNHNGWLSYQGGDQIWFWTTSWLHRPRVDHRAQRLARLVDAARAVHVDRSGPGSSAACRRPLLLQALVIAPIALWCVYELGAAHRRPLIGY